MKTTTRNSQDIDISRLEMMKTYLVSLMDEANCQKLMFLSPEVIEPIYNGSTRMSPATIFINTGSPEDMAYIRQKAMEKKEEFSLIKDNHTCHFDGPDDQGRDKPIPNIWPMPIQRSALYRKK